MADLLATRTRAKTLTGSPRPPLPRVAGSGSQPQRHSPICSRLGRGRRPGRAPTAPEPASWQSRCHAFSRFLLSCGHYKLGPVFHRDTREQLVFALCWFEDGCFPFLDIEPVLAEGVDDVRLVRDENIVFALGGRLGQHV